MESFVKKPNKVSPRKIITSAVQGLPEKVTYPTTVASRNIIITYTNTDNATENKRTMENPVSNAETPVRTLTTQHAVEYLLKGELDNKVCRYCLYEKPFLYNLDQVFKIPAKAGLYSVSISDMVNSFYPYQIPNDPNLPNKMCDKCLDKTISSYLFTRQCEQTGRALRDCFNDVNEKLDKLDSLEKTQKRGRHKLRPNYNKLILAHKNVIDYAPPLICVVNRQSTLVNENEKPVLNELECPRCWLVLPNLQLLVDHEHVHPKSMWYNCRICGASFQKNNQLKKHQKASHLKNKTIGIPKNTEQSSFKCNDCGTTTEGYAEHLQHIEKHKFKIALKHILEQKVNVLCSCCLKKDKKLLDLNALVSLHGGSPALNGDFNVYNILGSTVPVMNFLHNYTGTKICEKCIDSAINSYIFIYQTQHTLNRLKVCISRMLDGLTSLNNPLTNVSIEVSKDLIFPVKENGYLNDLMSAYYDDVNFDEAKLKIDVLEDEFRVKDSDDDSESEQTKITSNTIALKNTVAKLQMNGVKQQNHNVCSEFLTFKKKIQGKKQHQTKFTCPICAKHFISDHYLEKHVLKHVYNKVKCSKCLRQFNSKFNLHEHIKMVHVLKKLVYMSCKICGRTFTDSIRMKSHKLTHINKQCCLCEKIFATQKHLDSHMQRHNAKLSIISNSKKQICSFCEIECLDQNKLVVHVNKIHLQVKPFHCDMCHKVFYTEVNLMRHKKIHSIFSKETCEFCRKTLKSRKSLVIHVRKHIGCRPKVCLICEESFYSDFKLRVHMVKCHGGKFLCKLCRNVFPYKRLLKSHVNSTHMIFSL